MRAFAPVAGYDYNLCHLLSSTCRLCVFCAGAALCRQNLMGEEKSQCHAVGRHFSQTKKCVSALFCRAARGRRSEPLASLSEERRGLMGLLFHSICRRASCRPSAASVTPHTSVHTPSNSWQALSACRRTPRNLNRLHAQCGLGDTVLNR